MGNICRNAILINLKNKEILLMTGIILLISLFLMHLSSSHSWNYDETVYQLDVKGITYDLHNPNQKWKLPKVLEEISGLSFYAKNQLACIQDEDGIFYVYDLKKQNIVRKDQFGKKGDYEAVEVVADTAYVLESNGDIYFFHIDKKGIGEVHKIKTDLRLRNDTEGLGYHEEGEELLISCKEDPETKKNEIENGRSIYRVELAENKFKKKPKYVIDGKSYTKMLDRKNLSKKKHRPFKPSGVAVHPITGYIFVIGTVGKMMVVLNPEGAIHDVIPLNPQVFWQPEGICFTPNGDLYISSEGRGKNGYILKFVNSQL